MSEPQTVYEAMGGSETIGRLVDAFYRRVQAHPNLSRLFPEDIIPVRNKQYKFLTQLFGGPRLYSDIYGPPMLRAKHLPHPITLKRAEEWLSCMAAAMDEIGFTGPVRDFVFQRLTMTAHHMINSEDPPEEGDRASAAME
ncbi:MAG: globin [Alicyclobacillus sp.]|nr:globin [Alicyclobacillus sp.]